MRMSPCLLWVRTTFQTALFLATLLSISTSVLATRTIEAEGSAVIMNGAVQLARQQAIRSAMKYAAMQLGAQVDTSTAVSANVLIIDSTRINASGTVKDVQVIDEWQDNGLLYVRIRAVAPKQRQSNESPSAAYRKKIAAVQFSVLHRTHTHDLPGIEKDLPRELLRRLETSEDYLVVDGTDYLVGSPYSTANFDHASVVTRIAEKLGAQILITGTIRDMGINKGLIFSSRRAEIEVSIFDGLSGTKLASHRFSETADDASYFKRNTANFSQPGFLQSNFGKTLNRMLDRQVEMLTTDINKVPFSARVLRASGKIIYFDAGDTSKVRVGDTLTAYRLNPEPVRAMNQRFLGREEEALSSLVITRVQSGFAVGELETQEARLFAGDLIRFGW